MAPLSRFWFPESIQSLLKAAACLLLLLLTACSGPTPSPPLELFTGAYGEVSSSDGRPADAFIYAYPPSVKNMRGPADFAIRTEPDGSYILDLPPGSYQLVARFRPTGITTGPPKQGDIWAPAKNNPVAIRGAQPVKVNFNLSATTTPQLQTIPHLESGSTGFSGRAVTANGKPLAGIEILAYSDSNTQRIPDYRGDATNGRGEFQIYLPETGNYCLVLRERIKGQPRSGELFATIDMGGECMTITPDQLLPLGSIPLWPYGSR